MIEGSSYAVSVSMYHTTVTALGTLAVLPVMTQDGHCPEKSKPDEIGTDYSLTQREFRIRSPFYALR